MITSLAYTFTALSAGERILKSVNICGKVMVKSRVSCSFDSRVVFVGTVSERDNIEWP